MTVTATHPRDDELASLAGIREAALRRLPPDAAIYLESGAGTEATLRANRGAFARWAIRPRPMTGVSDPDTSATLLGMPLAIPVLTAPFGGDGLFWPDGQQSVARASARCGTLSIVPEVGTFSYETVRAAAPAAARIAQLHPYESFRYAARRIRDAGYDALCVTVDCPMTGYREGGAVARGIPDRQVWSGNHLGYSLGGYLVARAGAFEHRVAALVLDDGIYDFHSAFDRSLPPFLGSWIAEGRDDVAVPVLTMLTAASTQVRWALRNGVWAFGTDSFADLIRKAADYTLDGVADQITAPALILDGENDQFLKGQPQLVEKALTSAPTTLVTLTSAEGAGEHTHAGALGRAHPVMFDWLDTTLAR